MPFSGHTWEERKAQYNRHYFVDYGGYITEDDVPIYKFRDQENIIACARIIREISGAKSVLDCGCANGWLIDAFRMLDPDIYVRGFDVSPYAISCVVPEIRDCVSVCDISEGLPYEGRSFDLVIGFDILEHLQDYGAIMTAVKEMTRIAKERVLLRQPMVIHLTPCESEDPGAIQQTQHAWIETLNVLSHEARLALIGVHPYLAPSRPDPDAMEHPNEHPREFWIALFKSMGYDEISIPAEYYMFPNPLHLCSFNTLMFVRRGLNQEA
jgi:SAM-dependent methyltransferase